MIKTYRGLLTDTSPGNQNRIRLSTIKGKMGYKIVKFQIITELPGATQVEFIVKVYKEEQTTVDGAINFSDSTLLAAAEYGANDNGWTTGSHAVIFDNEVFNQDIYITGIDVNGSYNVNYYLELEVIPLDDAGAEYTTLKDMRST